MGKFFQVAL
jgi:hypothetical protein